MIIKRNMILSLIVTLLANVILAQTNALKVVYYYPKDSLKFEKDDGELDYNYEGELYGKTTMIIHCESRFGYFEFVFKKKINKLSRIVEYKDGAVSEIFNFKTKHWEHEEGTNDYKGSRAKPLNTVVYSEHNLYAFVLVHDHGGILEKLKFQDFGNVVYWPEFDYSNCFISDENHDGKPEFYLSYMGESDGLDAKPFKQIIYAFSEKPNNKNYVKSKATSFYPAGNEDDVYNIEYDTNWKELPESIKAKSRKILKEHKIKYKM
ncbi:hypothetical protein DOS84_06410 [Flavobacterium aquariorum]|uniref:Uncharacterized protein n=1 Tax=Flavobacterium aquariorum TaxID=2217670 RepID=A0A2W7VQ38_9FLAO|nr:hypothetical protein [Flavobacterium aquariorum]PZX94252.1 hypothetical protein DOS84_06410 [Flavobacterium aquariorum]